MTLDWLRFWPELVRLNLLKARHRRRVLGRDPSRPLRPAPCQSAPDSGRPRETRCEACHRFDSYRRYRHVCPDLVFIAGDARCGRDSTEIRPRWGRAAAQVVLPILAAFLCAGLATWGVLRSGGLKTLSPLDVLIPSRWDNIAEHRRAHFQLVAVRAIAGRDPATASVALLSAAQTGRGTVESNVALARLATLGGYHSLADELHASTLAARPERASTLAVAWLDDLLLAHRPHELARLALERLALPDGTRELWLRAFFESIRHPGVAADLLDRPPASGYPHPGLRFALSARRALDADDRLAAADQLLALSGAIPGAAVRRFLALSWLDAKEPDRAREATLSTLYPAAPGEVALLSHALLRAAGHPEGAREALRALFGRDDARAQVLAALVRDPDAALLREFSQQLPPATRADPRTLSGLWIAARRAGSDELAAQAASDLERLGHTLPREILTRTTSPEERAPLALIAALLPVDRDMVFALREKL